MVLLYSETSYRPGEGKSTLQTESSLEKIFKRTKTSIYPPFSFFLSDPRGILRRKQNLNYRITLLKLISPNSDPWYEYNATTILPFKFLKKKNIYYGSVQLKECKI